MEETLDTHLGDPGSIPGLFSPFVPILLDCLFNPFEISRHFEFAADSRVGNQSFVRLTKKCLLISDASEPTFWRAEPSFLPTEPS